MMEGRGTGEKSPSRSPSRARKRGPGSEKQELEGAETSSEGWRRGRRSGGNQRSWKEKERRARRADSESTFRIGGFTSKDVSKGRIDLGER